MPSMLVAERKRKRQAAALAEDIDTEAQAHAFLAKRRRQQPIETGLAALSLTATTAALPPPAPAIPVPSPPPPSQLPPTVPTASTGAFSVLLPSPVPVTPAPAPVLVDDDEPTSPEIQMKSSSWYEPEKDRKSCIHSGSIMIRLSVFRTHNLLTIGIVVTDLDSLSDSGDEGGQSPPYPYPYSSSPSNTNTNTAQLTIPAAILAALKSISMIPAEPPKESDDSAAGAGKALVLFRPPVWPLPSARARPSPRVKQEIETIHMPTPNSYDVAPMDVDP